MKEQDRREIYLAVTVTLAFVFVISLSPWTWNFAGLGARPPGGPVPPEYPSPSDPSGPVAPVCTLPTVNFTYQVDGVQVTFTDTSGCLPAGATFLWDFADRSSGAGATITHVYSPQQGGQCYAVNHTVDGPGYLGYVGSRTRTVCVA